MFLPVLRSLQKVAGEVVRVSPLVRKRHRAWLAARAPMREDRMEVVHRAGALRMGDYPNVRHRIEPINRS